MQKERARGVGEEGEEAGVLSRCAPRPTVELVFGPLSADGVGTDLRISGHRVWVLIQTCHLLPLNAMS